MHHRRKTRKHRKSNNILKKTVDKGVKVVKTTSKKYMPKVKSGLENVGSKVIKGSKRTVPYLQGLTRKALAAFSIKRQRRR